jgi:glycerol-3-phosphate dehydrogenase subunit B
LAEAIEEPGVVDALANVLRPVVKTGERVLFPAILGLTRHAQVTASLESAFGAPVAEIPTLPPSVPGMRLQRALVHTLAQVGGRIETNMAATEFSTDHSTEGKAIQWVATATAARPLRHRARAYLLATGGILGGGFNSDHHGRTWETIFDLPLTLPPDRGTWFRPEFLDAAGHPVFQGGVQVNPMWQPVDAAGNVVYENLWAAGNLLAHADSIRTRSHEGLALATGAAAIQALLMQRMLAATKL